MSRAMFGIQFTSKTGLTQGVGYNINIKHQYEASESSAEGQRYGVWKEEVKSLLAGYGDRVFENVDGHSFNKPLAEEICRKIGLISKINSIDIDTARDVPFMQITGIDAQDSKKGRKLEYRMNLTDGKAEVSITHEAYESAVPQLSVNAHDGHNGLSAAKCAPFHFVGGPAVGLKAVTMAR